MENNNEIWKEIPDTNGRYLISSLGNVYSKISKKVLKPYNINGYVRVEINNKNRRVHRLVGDSFVPNPHNKPFINHINADKRDNRAVNLEWCTTEENNLHSEMMGLGTPSIKVIRVCLDSGEELVYNSINEAAKSVNNKIIKGKVNSSGVRKVLNGTNKTHRGYKFKYFQQ
jgi:hypothetical protein